MTDIVVEITENNTQVTVSAPDVIVVTDVPPATSAAASAALAAGSEAAAAASETTASAAAVTATTQAGISTTQAGIATAAASTATTQAGLASGYATNAQSYMTSALGYRNDAQTAAGTATTQAGLASGYADAAAANAAAAAAAVAIGVAAGTLPASFTTLKASEHIALAATKRLYLDGIAATGDTYLVESSANVLDLYAGGANTLRLTPTAGYVTGLLQADRGASANPAVVGINASGIGDAQFLAEGRYNAYGAGYAMGSRTTSGGTLVTMAKIVADGTAAWNTDPTTQDAQLSFHVAENGTLANVGQWNYANLTVAGGISATARSGSNVLSFTGSAVSSRTGYLFADANYVAVGDTGNLTGTQFIADKTNTQMIFQVGNAVKGYWKTTGLVLNATQKLFLDGGGDTYLVEPSANQVDIYAGGVRAAYFTGGRVIGVGDVQGLKHSYFGYSATYHVVQLGILQSNSAISLGVDVSGNPSGGFTGNEIILPHSKYFIAPNAANTAFNNVFNVETSGRLVARSGLMNKQGGDSYINGLVLQRSATVDSWSMVVGGDNSLYVGYATAASGADASGDFTSVLTASGSGITVAGTLTANAGATVTGIVTASDVVSTGGGVGLQLRYGATDFLNIFGAMYSSGATMLGYGVRSSTVAGNTFLSTSAAASHPRGALTMDNALRFWQSNASTIAVGAAATLTENFTITTTGDMVTPATKKHYLDGASGSGGDTYLVESSANVLGFYAGGTNALSLSTTGAAITGTVSTTDPAGGAGPAWKLGVAAAVSPTSPNRTLRVDVAGTSYYLAAKTTND